MRRSSHLPAALRIAWWGVLVSDAVQIAAVIAAARLFDRGMFYLFLIGPLMLAAVLALVAWWHTRGPGRSLWRSL